MSTKPKGSMGLAKSLKASRGRPTTHSNYLLRNASTTITNRKKQDTAIKLPTFSQNVRMDFEDNGLTNKDGLKMMETNSHASQPVNCVETSNLQASEIQFEDDLRITSLERSRIDAESEASCVDHLQDKIPQESKKLIFEKIIPITKSANKVIIIGASPFQNFKVICKFTTGSLNHVLEFGIIEFDNFMTNLSYIIENIRENASDQLLYKSQKFHVYLTSDCLIKLIDTFNKTYLFYTKETLQLLVALTDFIRNCISNIMERVAQNRRINIDGFLADVAIENFNRSDESVRSIALNVVKNKYDNCNLLYEIVLLYPIYIENSVNEKLKYMLDHNRHP